MMKRISNSASQQFIYLPCQQIKKGEERKGNPKKGEVGLLVTTERSKVAPPIPSPIGTPTHMCVHSAAILKAFCSIQPWCHYLWAITIQAITIWTITIWHHYLWAMPFGTMATYFAIS